MDPNYALTPNKYLLPPEQRHLEGLLEKYREKDLRNTTLLLFMLRVGARPQEVLNVTWGDVNFFCKTVYLKSLKGGRHRNIPMKPDLIVRLKELGVGNDDERIFKIGYGMFRAIWNEFRPVKKKLHSLRHTFAVNLYIKSNYNLRLVQVALGHKNMTTTAIYLEIEMSNAELRKALD